MQKLSKAQFQNEISLICVITVLLIPIVVFSPSDVLRIVFGLPLVFLFPGYTLTAALFPGKGDLSRFERVAFSIMLSVVLVPLIGFILNYIWEIRLYPVLLSLTLFIFTTSAAALWRRYRLPQGERFALAFHFSSPSWLGQGSLDKLLSVLLVAAIFGATGTSVYTYLNNRQDYTEFYILGAEGKAEGYSQQLRVGQEGEVLLVIENHEHRDVSYQVEVVVVGQEPQVYDVTLADGERWQKEASFSFDSPGDDRKVEFVLFKDGEPYFDNSPHLWIDVSP